MANILYISDLAAPELAPFARLTEAQLRSRRDPAAGVFIAESLDKGAACHYPQFRKQIADKLHISVVDALEYYRIDVVDYN